MTSSSQRTSGLWRIPVAAVVWRTLVLVGVATVVGFIGNRVRQHPLALSAYQPPTQCSEANEAHSANVLSAQAIASMCGRDDVLFADARNESEFAQGHVTGATHLACTSSRGDIGQLFEHLRNKRTLVVYGNSTEEAQRVADSLLRQTERHDLSVIVLQGGFVAWRDSGLACSSGACEGCNETSSSHP